MPYQPTFFPYSDPYKISEIPDASLEAAGVMTPAQVAKLDSLVPGPVAFQLPANQAIPATPTILCRSGIGVKPYSGLQTDLVKAVGLSLTPCAMGAMATFYAPSSLLVGSKQPVLVDDGFYYVDSDGTLKQFSDIATGVYTMPVGTNCRSRFFSLIFGQPILKQ